MARRLTGQYVLVRIRRERNPVSAKDIAGEALLLAGGGRALILQIAHPAVGRGVVEHSDFEHRIMQRFHATVTFIYASVFATPEQFEVVRRSVNRAHATVRGASRAEAPAYNAFDPVLQLWVAATLYQTMMVLSERVFGPVPEDDAERLYRELIVLGSSLQVAPEDWPATRSDFEAYWSAGLAQLRSTPETRAVARQILYPAEIPGWMKAVFPLARLITVGLLPDEVRRDFRLAWNDRLQRRFDRWMRAVTILYPLVPARLRHLPRDRYLARLGHSVTATGAG